MKVKWKTTIGVIVLFVVILVCLLFYFGVIFSESFVKITHSAKATHKELDHKPLLMNSLPRDNLEYRYDEYLSHKPAYYNSPHNDGFELTRSLGIMSNYDLGLNRTQSLSQVDKLLEEMEWGEIVFNAPTNINIDDSPQIQLFLSLAETVEQLKQLITEEGLRIGAIIKVRNKMKAHLSGNQFIIKSMTDEIQVFSKNQRAEWEWEIFPKKKGRHDLHLTLSAVLKIDGESTSHTIKTFDRTIEVDVTGRQTIQKFLMNHWKWLWVTILAPIGWILWGRLNQDKIS